MSFWLIEEFRLKKCSHVILVKLLFVLSMKFDRDRMVLESPHLYGGVDFSFVRHNQGRNWRRIVFNQECWLMLMGLPEDFWEQEFIESVLGPCARVIS